MLGPVHVGSGQALNPLDYIVREGADGVIWFHPIDAGRIFGNLSDRQRADLDGATRSGGPAGYRRFLASQFDPAKHALWACQADEVLLRAQGPAANDRGPRGQRERPVNAASGREAAPPCVYTMTRTGATGQPYLPGSSIKGAIRTAYLWWRAGAGEPRPSLEALAQGRKGNLFEAEVLGYRVVVESEGRSVDTADPHADPLRSVRVTDAPLCPDSNVIERVVLLEAQGEEAREPLFVDATFSSLEGEAGEQITATGQLAVDRKLQAHRVPEGLRAEMGRRWRWPRAVAEEVTAEQLLEACRRFYLENLHKEVERFYRPNQYLRPVGERLAALAGRLGPNEALLRVGRFSHFENMTVRPYAQGASRTRGLAGALRPMGWVKMRLDPA